MRRLITCSAILAVLALSSSLALAGDPKTAFNDPEAAGPDFQVQGEYLVELIPPANMTEEEIAEALQEAGIEKLVVGVQVIARGDGQFEFLAYRGGLPGEGAKADDPLHGKGKTGDDGVTFLSIEQDGESVEDARVEIKDGQITFFDPNGAVAARGKKVLRKSKTLGAKPPEEAVVLFDGTSPDAFQGGRMTEDGLLMEGATSKQTFQDFTIHIEFRTPFQPWARGQQRGNSGFYAQGRYETQILDSFGLSGEWNECGGIYKIAKPKVNMCYPPLSWQTYDIDFTAAEYDASGKKTKDAEFTVKHNGIVIHENQVLPHATTAAPVKEGPEPGPVFLQNHGNPVRFRNIWVVPK